jgi:hypothetical protein
MEPTVFALLFKEAHPAPGGSGAVLVFIPLAVGIVVLARLVLGGSDQPGGNLLSSSSDVPEPRQRPAVAPESIHGWGTNLDGADAEFEASIAETIPMEAQEKSFYVKVRGTSYRNSDGTSRTRIIGECSVLESLALLPQPDDPDYPNAIRVCRATTLKQLGFLESRLGEQISRDMQKNGARWVAFFRRETNNPESGRTAGAVIRLIRLSEEFIEQSDAVRLKRL